MGQDLVTYTNLTQNRTHPRQGVIDTITVHCFVGQVTARLGCNYFAAARDVSANYMVGYDGSIGLSVPEEDRSWATGGSYTVNGITGKMNDHRAVTVEVACDVKEPYAVTDAAYEALIRLVADIAKRNSLYPLKWRADKSLVGKPREQNMTAHRWFAAKACPGDYLYTRMGDIAARANQIIEEEIEMTREEVKALIDQEVERKVEPIRKEVSESRERVFQTMAEIRKDAPWAESTVRRLIDQGRLRGTGGGRDANGDPTGLELGMGLLRTLVIMERPAEGGAV